MTKKSQGPKRYHLADKTGPQSIGLSNSPKAKRQRRYRVNNKAGLKYFPGIGHIEPSLIEHVLRAVTDKLPMSAGPCSVATLKRVMQDHLRGQWVEFWRPEWELCQGFEAYKQVPHRPDNVSFTDPLWFWSDRAKRC